MENCPGPYGEVSDSARTRVVLELKKTLHVRHARRAELASPAPSPGMKDPDPIVPKGRPRNARIRSAAEAGGAKLKRQKLHATHGMRSERDEPGEKPQRKERECAYCKGKSLDGRGHDKRTCPVRKVDSAAGL